LRPVEGLYYALERFGIMSWNPVTDALNAIDKALYDVKMSTEDAMNTAISKSLMKPLNRMTVMMKLFKL